MPTPQEPWPSHRKERPSIVNRPTHGQQTNTHRGLTGPLLGPLGLSGDAADTRTKHSWKERKLKSTRIAYVNRRRPACTSLPLQLPLNTMHLISS